MREAALQFLGTMNMLDRRHVPCQLQNQETIVLVWTYVKEPLRYAVGGFTTADFRV